MWGIAKDSEGEPSGELWGLFLPDGDVTWQNKALCLIPLSGRSMWVLPS